MSIKGIIFALIAAGVGGMVSEGVERGLNAADAKLHQKPEATEEETTEEETTEE